MDIEAMMKQAQQMQVRMQDLQRELAETRVEIYSEGIGIVLTAGGVLVDIEISPELLDDTDPKELSKLIVDAHGKVKERADEIIAAETNAMMLEMNLPEEMRFPSSTTVDPRIAFRKRLF